MGKHMNLKWMRTYLNIWRIVPVYFFSQHCKHTEKINADLAIWIRDREPIDCESHMLALGYYLTNYKELRNIVLNRLRRNLGKYIIARILFPPMDTLYIHTPSENIGGVFIRHGFATIIVADEIGENCCVFQQVTVGYNKGEKPRIGNDVTVYAGAIIAGGIEIKNGAAIGAGAVVMHDVSSGDVVVGCPARSIRNKKIQD